MLLCQPFKDKDGKAIGVSACDVDGDGDEEVFIGGYTDFESFVRGDVG